MCIIIGTTNGCFGDQTIKKYVYDNYFTISERLLVGSWGKYIS